MSETRIRHNIKGVHVDFKNNRFQWFPEDLEENIFLLLGSLARAYEVKLEGDVYELVKGEYAVNFIRPSAPTLREGEK